MRTPARQPSPRAAMLSLALASAAVTTASAHAFLQTAQPAVGSAVQQAPSEVAITFTEGVEPAFSTIAVTDATGQPMAAGPPHLEGPDTVLAVALKPLQPGTYTVTWHATAIDTHKTEGHYRFTVGP